MKLAVVGHVEWIRFVRVDEIPGPGEIAHAHETWEQAGGAYDVMGRKVESSIDSAGARSTARVEVD